VPPDDDDTVALPPRRRGADAERVVPPDSGSADTILRATPRRERQELGASAPAVQAHKTQESISATVLGFRLGDSPIVLLDTVVYLGRKPSPPRVTRGAAPRLVRVISATNEVSSTHVELRQLGAMVVVTDLKSTNGTRVLLPGHPVRSLRPGESITIGVGTLIDVGDGNVIELVRPGVSL
jgi:pSer/pThr/pTyr-binding forkhead associated (FHA) protein